MNIQIVQHEPDRLRLVLKPKASAWMILFGLGFIAVGIFCIYALGMTCSIKTHNENLILQKSFLGAFELEHRVLPLRTIEDINISTYRSWIYVSNEVNIVTSDQELLVPLANLDGDAKRNLANRLKLSLSSGMPFTYDTGLGGALAGLILGLCCIAGGLIILAMLQTSTITADRDDDQFTVRIRRWLIRWMIKTNSVPISSFARVKEAELASTSSSGIRSSSKSVFLTTRDGHSLNLASGPMFTNQSATRIRKLIEDWVNEESSCDN